MIRHHDSLVSTVALFFLIPMRSVYMAPFAGLVLLMVPALAQAPAAAKLPAAMIPLPERTIVKPVLDCAALAKLEITDIPGAPVRILSAN
jgi:hypothetical protein